MKGQKLLRVALTLNAAFSALTGFLLIYFSSSIKIWFGFDYEYWQTGIGLILFVGLLVFVLRAPNFNLKLVSAIIIMDVMWCVLSAVVLFLVPLSTLGVISIVIAAAVVADLAFFQYKGLTGYVAEGIDAPARTV